MPPLSYPDMAHATPIPPHPNTQNVLSDAYNGLMPINVVRDVVPSSAVVRAAARVQRLHRPGVLYAARIRQPPREVAV